MQRGGKCRGRGVELERLGAGERAFGLAAHLTEALGQASLAARRADDDCQELFVEKQPSLVELVSPTPIDFGRDRIGVAGAEVDLNRAPDHMVVEDRLGIERAAKHDVAHREQVVEDVVILGLKREAR